MQTQTHSPTTEGTGIEKADSSPLDRAAETRAQMVQLTPAVDIFENAEELLIRTDLPGITGEEVEVRVEQGVLSIAATSVELRRVYRRTFTLADVVDPSEVDAELDNGVLSLRLRKREDMMPRRIQVRSAG